MIKLRTANVFGARELAALDYTGCDLLMVNYNQEIVFASYYEIPQPIKLVRALSFEGGITITLCARLKIEDESYYSVAVFDKGIFLGISDSLTEPGVTIGKSIKIYSTSAGKFGVSVGTDFLCPQSENVMCGGADYILHHTLEKFGCGYICAVKGHAVFGTNFVGLYSDICVKSDGRTECIPVGQNFVFKLKEKVCTPPVMFLKLSKIE